MRVLLALLLIVVMGLPLAAQETTPDPADTEIPAADGSILVTTTTGRVQYQRDATSWRSLVSGRPAPLDTPITTRADAAAVFDVAGVILTIGPLTALRFVEVSPAAISVELRSGTLEVTALTADTVVVVTLPRGTIRSEGATFRITADRVDTVGSVGVVTAASALGHPRRVWPGEAVLLGPVRPVSTR